MDFENKKNEIEQSSQEQKTENKENLEISDVLNEGTRQLSDAVERSNQENKQAISNMENYPGAESEDIEVAQEIITEAEQGVSYLVETSNNKVSEIIDENDEASDGPENISPEIKSETDKLKFLQEEKIRLQKRYEELEKGYKENFQLVSKKELSWYESEMNSIHSKLDNMRYSIPSLEEKIETLKSSIIESKEKKNNINQNDSIIKRSETKDKAVEEDSIANKDTEQITEKVKENIEDTTEKNSEINQEKYKRVYDTLISQVTGYGNEKVKQSNLENVKQNFNLLDNTSVQEIDKKLARLENDGSYIDTNKILNEAISNYKDREISKNFTEEMPSGLNVGEKFSFIEKKVNELDDNGQLHGISARQLNSLFKQVLKGEKTITDLKENNFTLGKNKIPLSLNTVAEDILLHDMVIPNMNTLKRVAKSLDLRKSYMDEIEKIEKGEYVRPEGHYGVLIEKANEIMGLKKPSQKHNSDSQWTDRNNPPTRWDKNAKVGDKIRK